MVVSLWFMVPTETLMDGKRQQVVRGALEKCLQTLSRRPHAGRAAVRLLDGFGIAKILGVHRRAATVAAKE